jgi:beta-glucosidase
MRKIYITAASLLLLNVISPAVQAQKKPVVNATDKKVDALIAKMTLEEKVGQMTEVTSDVVSKTKRARSSVGCR